MMGENFKELISDRSDRLDSRLIMALDVRQEDLERGDLEEKYLGIAEEAAGSIAAVKVGYPLVLKTDIKIITRISEEAEVPVIADFKIADVPHICGQIAGCAFDAGANAVIAHAFVGRDSLESVVETALEKGEKGVIAVPNMSHTGGEDFIQKSSDEMVEMVKDIGVTGVIGPATRPEDVERMRSEIGDEMLLLTPGIGAQGGRPGDAVRSGADFEIVGRAIYTADSPGESAERIRKQISEVAGD